MSGKFEWPSGFNNEINRLAKEQAAIPEEVSPPITIRRYTVDICDPCAKLEGQECHTAGCIFFLCDMAEVREFMHRALIAPVIDGERFILQKGRFVCREK